MRIFVYEYACAQPRDADLPESIRVEGQAMQAALMEDFGRISGVAVETLRECPREAERERFQQLAGAAEWTVVIAPEFEEILLERCRWVLEVGGRLLGPELDVVAATGDKWATCMLLDQHWVLTPRTWLNTAHLAHPVIDSAGGSLTGAYVHKPRRGAGSLDVRLCRHAVLPSRPDYIVQEYIPGQAASVAFLTGPNESFPLLPARQILSTDGRFRYLGGSLPLPEPLAERAIRIATQAIACLRSLRGYLGVDLVLGESPDGRQDHVIEINPRLTTSYVGLRVLTEGNLAEAMLRIAEGKEIAPIRWRKGSVEFNADGEVRLV